MAMVYKLGYNIPKKEINKRVFEYPKLVAQIQALTADKDEQAGRIMQYDAVLRQTRQILSGVNVARCPYCWGKDTHHENCDIKIVIDAIEALLGGKEE